MPVAAIDIAGFVADLKDHAVEHGFHVHDERHFVESYSLRQTWEVDVHPEDACEGPVDLYLSLEVDPREIGRASCRERGEVAVGDVESKKKTKRRETTRSKRR